jgi:hypothetical protein
MRSLIARVLVAGVLLLQGPAAAPQGGKHMQVKGTFEVKVTAAEATAFEKETGVGRYEVDKVWDGDFVGTSKGEMLTSFTESTGSMAYVAMERVTGKLGGKSGSFYFAHMATMKKGDAASGVMKIVVVKDSGTGELSGLSGELTIVIDAKGGHSYVFEYELP